MPRELYGLVAQPGGDTHARAGEQGTAVTVCGRPVERQWIIGHGLVDGRNFAAVKRPCAACLALMHAPRPAPSLPPEPAPTPAAEVEVIVPDAEPIHEFFGLSYSSYLVLPRAVLQSMPVWWQERLVALLDAYRAAVQGTEADVESLTRGYRVEFVRWLDRDLRGEDEDAPDHVVLAAPLGDYERGRRRVALNRLPDPGG